MRKSHRKSRNGCKNCKRRHVKCDEKKPCTSCARHGIECNYEALYISASPSRSPEYRPATLSPAQPLHTPRPSLNMLDLRLFHHFSTYTAETLNRENDQEEIVLKLWKTVVPELALSNPMLMHALLGMAASHLLYIKGGRDNETRAASQHHRTEALGQLKYEMENLSLDSDYNALLASVLILAMQSFRAGGIPKDNVHDWFRVLRLIVKFPTGIWERSNGFILNPLLQYDGDELDIENPDPIMLSELVASDDPSLDVYREAIKFIAGVIGLMVRSKTNSRAMLPHVIRWAVHLPPEFIDLMRQNDPRAMVILAHYYAVMSLIPGRWWLENFAITELQGICRSIPEPYQHLLAWPREVMQSQGVTSR